MDQKEIAKLREGMSDSLRQMRPYKIFRRNLIKEYVGDNYGEDSFRRKNPTNLWAMAVDTYLSALSGGIPQLSVTPAQPGLMGYAADFEAVVNQELRDLDMKAVVNEWVKEALFGLGVIKIGHATNEWIEIIPGHPQAVTKMYADNIDLDHFVMDMQAQSLDHCSFMAHRYRAIHEEVMDSPDFDTRGINLQPTDRTRLYEDDDGGTRVAQSIGITDYYDSAGSRRYVELWDVWLPEQGLIVTIPYHRGTNKALRVIEWEGPIKGPFHLLGLGTVPSNIMPFAPGYKLIDLHMLGNYLFRKMGVQAKQQKSVITYRLGNEKDADRIRKAGDLSFVGVNSPNELNTVTIQGLSEQNLGFYQVVDRTFSRLGGNLDAMGGLGPQSETLGQDELLNQQVSATMNQLRDEVLRKTTELCTHIGWMMWQDDTRSYRISRSLPGVGVDYEDVMQPEDREGDFLDYNFEVDVFSMLTQSPSQRAHKLTSILQLALQAYPMLQAQGMDIRFDVFLEQIAKAENLPEIRSMFTYGASTAEMTNPVRGVGGKAPETTRNYTRTNLSGTTADGNAAKIISQAFGGGGGGGDERIQLGA